MKSTNDRTDYPIRPIPFNRVSIDSGFWSPRIETNRTVTIPYDFAKCQETGRLANFARAGGFEDGPHEGHRFNDSDVFKVIEGAAYSLALHPDAELDAFLDDLIAKIAAAQEPDGYLFTARTLGSDDKTIGEHRWSNLRLSHELYNVGHLYEAAVAHYEATGKRTLLDVALRNADLVCETFGPRPGQLVDVPGHQEIEIGLVKLYRTTGKDKYLDLAKFFLDMRGRSDLRTTYGDYCQDHEPIKQQSQAVGHAVRAAYMYAGIAEVAALTGDGEYLAAIDRIWQDEVTCKLYITGGIGARHKGEAFGDAYELPNDTAYNETCAAIANVLFNQRMFLLHGDAKYIDVVERMIYNGLLSGVALSGDRFFYPNPLSWDGEYAFNIGEVGRSPWFKCSCCPVNVVRFLPSLGGYIYAVRDQQVYVNQFIGGSGQIELPVGPVTLTQRSDYPWDGRINLTVQAQTPRRFALHVRIPGWVNGQPVPSDLYHYVDPTPAAWTLNVNGQTIKPTLDNGYAVIERQWHDGDTVQLNLAMPIRQVQADERVQANRGRVALERGPVVYCVEATDMPGIDLDELRVADDAALSAEHRADLLGGVTVLTGQAGLQNGSETNIIAVPYYAWANRALGPMQVWQNRR
ncbi:MAG: glycoside hydrolase family 127 protein [Phycisphaeraceae bacterium]|nr:glycoside hydrolase family 127 protein [Phycisphaeraceae bacterium]